MAKYRYYTLYREPAPGAVPAKGVKTVKYLGTRKIVTELGIGAWGYVEYDRRLTPEEIADYELFETVVEDGQELTYGEDE